MENATENMRPLFYISELGKSVVSFMILYIAVNTLNKVNDKIQRDRTVLQHSLFDNDTFFLWISYAMYFRKSYLAYFTVL